MIELTSYHQKVYREAKRRFESDEEFEQRAKACTVRLQSAQDPMLTKLWETLTEKSLHDFARLYERLGVSQDRAWFLGESFYQDKVDIALEDLASRVQCGKEDKSVLLYSGLPSAKFPSKNPDEDPIEVPLVLRKSDGGFGYDATDVAAVRYRLLGLRANEIIYVTDNGQSLHFELVFHAAKLAGWLQPGENSLVHVGFGVVTKAAGGGRIKTREGDVETLDALLDKAAFRIQSILESKRPTWTNEERQVLTAMAEKCGVLCIAFAELKTPRASDYEFNVDKMCNPDGNSGLFIVHVIRKIRRLLGPFLSEEQYQPEGAGIKERSLAVELLKFHDVVDQAIGTHSPHVLAGHLIAVCTKTSSLLEDGKENSTRLQQCLVLTRAAELVIKQHMELLGIGRLLEQMEPGLKEMASWKNADALL